MDRIKVAAGLEFSQVIGGFMRVIDSGLGQDEVLRYVEECLDLGITTYDHADIYGGYRCEAVFGEAVLGKRPELRKRMEIVTKADIVLPGYQNNDILFYDTSRAYLTGQCERSLKMLRTDCIDVLLLHRPDPLMDPAETADALDGLVASGKVRHVGVSNFTPSQVALLQQHLKNPIVTNQVPLSVQNPGIYFDGTVEDALSRGIALMIWSPLAGGRFFAAEDKDALRLRAKLEEVARAHDAQLDEIMYAWINLCPAPVASINGSFKMERVHRAVAAQQIRLSRLEWFQILQASRGYAAP